MVCATIVSYGVDQLASFKKVKLKANGRMDIFIRSRPPLFIDSIKAPMVGVMCLGPPAILHRFWDSLAFLWSPAIANSGMIFRPSQVALEYICKYRTLESTLKAQTVQSQDPQEHAESLRANSGMEY